MTEKESRSVLAPTIDPLPAGVMKKSPMRSLKKGVEMSVRYEPKAMLGELIELTDGPIPKEVEMESREPSLLKVEFPLRKIMPRGR
jgi:hypothetical protein